MGAADNHQNLLELGHVDAMYSLGGMSECGKSTTGIYLESLGIARLKIARFIESIGVARGYDIADPEFTDQLFRDDCSGTLREFVTRVAAHMRERGVVRASLESMYRPVMARYLKQVLGERMTNIYIKTPLELRIERQWRKKPERERSEADAEVRAKDEMKVRIGVPKLEREADMVIDNSGSVEMLRAVLRRVVGERRG